MFNPSALVSRIVGLLLLAPPLVLPVRAEAALAPIQPDGDYADWQAVPVAEQDPIGDGGIVDLGRLWVANDQNWLFLRFETTGEVQPDEQQDIRLYLDTDLDAATGLSISGIGADLVWEFGNRTGRFYTPQSSSIGHDDIGLQVGPTVSDVQFEIGLRRDAVPAGGQPLFPGAQLRMVLRDHDSGDQLPDAGSVAYTFVAGSLSVDALPLERAAPAHVRVVAWNIQGDGLFDPSSSKQAAFGRIFGALDPGVLVISEVWDHTASEVAAKLEGWLPSPAGEGWNAIGIDGGNVIATRKPILDSWEIFPGHRLSAALLDLRPQQDSDLLFVANHWRCCTADDARQAEADALIAFLRDARSPGGVIDLVPDTPIVAAGDFNLVGWRRQLETIVTGDILDNGAWGPDSPPDWDGSGFDIPPSRHPEARIPYTWYRATSSFYPGVLDWIFYTGSVLGLGNHYVLDTRRLSAEMLSSYGLQAADNELASDHVPRVADFYVLSSTDVPRDPRGLGLRMLPPAPNPFNPTTVLRFELGVPSALTLTVHDAVGRAVAELARGTYEAGAHRLIWDGRDGSGAQLSAGVYFARLSGPEGVSDTVKLVLVK